MKLALLIELHNHIQKAEQLLMPEFFDQNEFSTHRKKFVDYCAYVYTKLVHLATKSIFEKQFNKYVILAAEAQIPTHMITLARGCAHGVRGFSMDYLKARQLILSLPKEYQHNRDTIMPLAYSYLLEPVPNTKKALDTILAHVDRYPDLYIVLGDFFSDGFLGIEANPEKAIAYYQKAIDHKIDEGYVGLGVEKLDCYRYTSDTESQNAIRNDTLEYFQKAMKANSRDAAYFLARIYLYGLLGIKPNFEKAKEYLLEAVKDDQPYAKAMLEMIAAGYQGEVPYSLDYELIRQSSLKESGYIDGQPSSMFEYGIVNLYFAPQRGCKYLVKAAHYNDIDAKYLIATIQFLIDYNFCNIIGDAITRLNKTDYRYLMANDPPNIILSYIAKLYQFAKLLSRYIQKGYIIEQDYVFKKLMKVLSALNIDLQKIEEHIKEHFPPEEIRKTRLLAAQQEKQTRSGDEECQRATDKLLGSKNSSQMNLKKKIQRLHDSDKISMKCFSDCLSAFFNSGVNINSANNKKAIKAGEHMHTPHGGEHNNNQNLEGGRRETARQTLSALENELEGYVL